MTQVMRSVFKNYDIFMQQLQKKKKKKVCICMCVCQRQTCQGMHPWYQAWLFRFVPLSLSSSSSCFLSFSDGASNQNFSLENLKDMTGARWETTSPCTNTGRQQHEFKPLCDLCWLKVKSQQSLLSPAFFLPEKKCKPDWLFKEMAKIQACSQSAAFSAVFVWMSVNRGKSGMREEE